MRHESAPAAWRVVPAKFVGGCWRSAWRGWRWAGGPTVQMGASVGAEIGRRSGLHPTESGLLSAADWPVPVWAW